MNLLSVSSSLSGFLLKHRIKVKFVLVGAWNTIFGYLVFLVLDTLFASAFLRRYIAYMAAMVFSNVLTITNAYIFHKYITFKSSVRGKGILLELMRFAMTYGLTIGLSLLLLPVLVEILAIGPKTAAALVILICTMVSWVGHSRFSFSSSAAIHSEEKTR